MDLIPWVSWRRMARNVGAHETPRRKLIIGKLLLNNNYFTNVYIEFIKIETIGKRII